MNSDSDAALCRLCGGPRSQHESATQDGAPICSLCDGSQRGLAAKVPCRFDPLAVTGLLAAVSPLAVSFRISTQQSFSDGVTERATSRTVDYADLVGGGVALFLGILLAIKMVRARSAKRVDVAALVAVSILGAYHVVTGYRTTDSIRPADGTVAYSAHMGGSRVTIATSIDRTLETPACKVGRIDVCRRLCGEGDSAACLNLARSYQLGGGAPADISQAVKHYEQACNGSEWHACVELGLLYWNGAESVPVDLGRARQLFHTACPKGNAYACINLSAFLADGLGGPADRGGAAVAARTGCNQHPDACQKVAGEMYVNKLYSASAVLLEQACRLGRPSSCNDLGVHYEDGLGVVADLSKARELYADACARKHSLACRNLGSMHWKAKVYPAAEAVWGDGCDGADAVSCVRLAGLLAEGLGGTPDPERAAAMAVKGCKAANALDCHEAASALRDNQMYRGSAVLYDRACGLGHLESCNELGVLADHGRGGVVDRARALELFGLACEGGHTLACQNSGYAHLRDKNYVLAGLAFRDGCAGGGATACRGLAGMLAQGLGGPADQAGAAAAAKVGCQPDTAEDCLRDARTWAEGEYHAASVLLLDHACNLGLPGACNDLGVAYVHGKGVAADLAKSVELFGRACNAGHALGCSNLGLKHLDASDPTPARDAFRRGCAGADAVACLNLAALLAEGIGGPADSAGARAALEQAGCDRDSLEQCVEFTDWLYSRGQHFASALLLGRACELGRAASCNDLGVHYKRGLGLGVDSVKADELYAKACEGGSAVGCSNLGFLKLKSEGGEAEPAEALGLLGRACDLGSADACVEIANRHRSGDGLPKDSVLAETARGKACRAGDAKSCDGGQPNGPASP